MIARFVYLYDGRGNVGQLVEATGGPNVLRCIYEYDVYGNCIGPDIDGDGQWQDDADPYAFVNPFRFSTKFFDDGTGLGYSGYRYYSPKLGRWISRDPSGEFGGETLYRFVGSSPTHAVDPLGLEPIEVQFDAFIPGRVGTWILEPFGGGRLAVTVEVSGSHHQFPNCEVLINHPISRSQYQYDTPHSGPGFRNLSRRAPLQGNGYTLFVDNTPACCP